MKTQENETMDAAPANIEAATRTAAQPGCDCDCDCDPEDCPPGCPCN